MFCTFNTFHNLYFLKKKEEKIFRQNKIFVAQVNIWFTCHGKMRVVRNELLDVILPKQSYW